MFFNQSPSLCKNLNILTNYLICSVLFKLFSKNQIQCSTLPHRFSANGLKFGWRTMHRVQLILKNVLLAWVAVSFVSGVGLMLDSNDALKRFTVVVSPRKIMKIIILGFISKSMFSRSPSIAVSIIPDICHESQEYTRVNFFLAGVNFYRFNAKNWHFQQILL